MKTTILIAAAALTAAPVLADAPAKAPAEPAPGIRERERKNFDPWTRFKDWSESVQRELEAGRAIPPSRFDRLFDDDFFRQNADPFGLIDEFDRRFQSGLEKQEKALFGDSWRGWYADRLGLGPIEETTRTTDKNVTLSFRIPDLDASSVKLDVNGDRVRLSYSTRREKTRKDAKGRVVSRRESYARSEKIVPVPPQADPQTWRVRKTSGEIDVIFARERGASGS
jgi:HSP20 family molecular chaperone IbpA